MQLSAARTHQLTLYLTPHQAVLSGVVDRFGVGGDGSGATSPGCAGGRATSSANRYNIRHFAPAQHAETYFCKSETPSRLWLRRVPCLQGATTRTLRCKIAGFLSWHPAGMGPVGESELCLQHGTTRRNILLQIRNPGRVSAIHR